MTTPCSGIFAPAAAAATILMSVGTSNPGEPFRQVVQECQALIDEIGGLARGEVDDKLLCEIMCCCSMNPSVSAGGRDMHQQCVHETLSAADARLGYRSRYKSEISYDMTAEPYPRPFMHRNPGGQDTTQPSNYWQGRAREEIEGYQSGYGFVRRPDVVIVRDTALPPARDNIERVVEMKFEGDRLSPEQRDAYIEIAGARGRLRVMVEGVDCNCADRKPTQLPETVPVPRRAEVEGQVHWGEVAKTVGWGALTVVAAIGTAAAILSVYDGTLGDAAGIAATAGAAARTAAAFNRIFGSVSGGLAPGF